MQKKKSLIRFYFLNYLLLIISIFNFNCKLNLNNPGDPFSKAFLETFLLRAYLDSLCDPNVRGNVRLGSGSYFTVVNDLKQFNGDIYFSASVSEPVDWNGKTNGLNFSFSGSIPNANIIIGKVNGKSFQIEWIDYLGESNGNVQDATFASLFKFANGDVGVSTAVTTTQAGSINSKAADPTAAIHIVRYNPKGARVWSRYLNKPTSEFNASNSFFAIVDELDRIHFFYQTLNSTGTADTVGFSDLPIPSNQTSGQLGKNEIGWVTINGDGSGNSQRFIIGDNSNNHYITARSGVTIGNNIIIAGVSTGIVDGFPNHPAPGSSGTSTLFIKLGLDFSVQNVRYYGNTNGVAQDEIARLVYENNRLFAYGAGDGGGFGNPAQPFLSNSNSSILYMRTDSNLNLLWHSYLGSSTSGFANDPAILSIENRINALTSKLFGTFDGLKLTGYDSISSGSSVNPFPFITARLDPDTGTFRSLFYETNSNAATTAAITRLAAFRHNLDVCSGRMVKSKNVFLNNSGSIGFLEISTRPATEEP